MIIVVWILVSLVHHEDMTDFGRGVCNGELLHALILRGFPPYLVIGTKRGQINFVTSSMTS